MKFLEKNLEQIIFESDKDYLYERGLNISGTCFKRQLQIGNYGIADIISLQRPQYCQAAKLFEYGVITVFELKRKHIDFRAFLQAIRYIKGIKRYLEKRRKANLYNYKVVLIGESIDYGDFIYLTDLLCDSDMLYYNKPSDSVSLCLETYTFDYKIDGINFKKHQDYILAEEGF